MVIVEKSRKIEKLKVNFLSWVKYPANGKGIVIKADGSFNLPMRIVSKSQAEKVVYVCVYEPDTVDSQDDFADAPTIKDAAHDFLSSGRVTMVDQEHDYNANKGAVVESFIKNGTDNRFPDVKDGAWCAGIKPSPEVWDHIDEINGISMAGVALRKGDEDVFSTSHVRLSPRKSSARVDLRLRKR